MDGRVILKGMVCESINWIHTNRHKDKWQARNELVNLLAHKRTPIF